MNSILLKKVINEKIANLERVLSNPSLRINYTHSPASIIQEIENLKQLIVNIEKLQKFRYTTTGLWAIDRDPKEVSKEWIEQNAFQIKDPYNK